MSLKRFIQLVLTNFGGLYKFDYEITKKEYVFAVFAPRKNSNLFPLFSDTGVDVTVFLLIFLSLFRQRIDRERYHLLSNKL